MDKVLCMIPARLGSTRLKNKMLLEVDNKPIIIHTIERALATKHIGRVVVCTDSEEIKEAVDSYLLTELGVFCSLDLLSVGTGCDRTSITLLRHPKYREGLSNECILHLHGDEASVNPQSLDRLIENHVKRTPHSNMTQLMTRTYKKDEETRSSCKVDVNWGGRVLGYSRDQVHFYTALGAFAFDPLALLSFSLFEIKQEEHRSKIEQYRFIEHGVPIYGFDSGLGDVKTSIDTQSDFDRMKSLVQEY